MKPNDAIKEIDNDLLKLMGIKSMTEIDAINYANGVVKKINSVIEDGVEDKATLFSLYKKAGRAYHLASKTVPKEVQDSVAYPSNYWDWRAKETRIGGYGQF